MIYNNNSRELIQGNYVILRLSAFNDNKFIKIIQFSFKNKIEGKTLLETFKYNFVVSALCIYLL